MRLLSTVQARRIAVAAQGFTQPKPTGPINRAHLHRLIQRIRVLQLDSVSVAVRAHYAPVFSRLGGYDRSVLDRAAWGPDTLRQPRLLVEYWAHEAALIAVDDWPLLRWRMRQYRHGRWRSHVARANPGLAEEIVAAIEELGPATAGEIETHLASTRAHTRTTGQQGGWWSRSDTKWVAEALFAAGVLTTATRIGFTRHYDLARNVLPKEVFDHEVDDGAALRELVLRAATALGIGTAADIRDYFRLSVAQAGPAIEQLIGDGELERADVDGWDGVAYLVAGRAIPRTDRGTALLCPFDPLIFFRPRVERMFGFRYRIEIYTPAPRRRHGYYVWPLLLDGELVARVDLKTDRVHDALRVLAAFVEDGQDPIRVGRALMGELESMASWLKLGRIDIGDRGNLVTELKR